MNPELKSKLRQQLRGLASNPEISAQIARRLLEWPSWKTAKVIMGFMAMGSEPDVMPALREAFARGAKIAFPIVDGESIQPGAVASMSDEHFKVDAMGVRSPSAWTPIEIGAIDVVLVPGVAFDRSGARLGRGGGHYDRFLAQLAARTTTVGVADARRIVDRVPVEPHDRRVKWLVSDAEGVAETKPGLPI